MQTAIPLFRINGVCGISNMWFRSIAGTFENSIPRFERIEVNRHGKKEIYYRGRTGNVPQSD